MNYFSIRTNHQTTIEQLLENQKEITFEGLSWHINEVKIKDIIFIVISGDSSKKKIKYENGLIAIGRTLGVPEKTGKKHFKLNVEIQFLLPQSLTKDHFYLYPDLKDAPNIGPITINPPNQSFRKISLEQGENIIKSIIDITKDNKLLSLFPDLKYTRLNKLYTNSVEIKKIKNILKDKFQQSLKEVNLIYSDKLITRYIASLATKPFVLLSGLSGSGKTKIAQAFATWICENESQYKIIPVGADWTNREPLLGYVNALDQTEYILPENGALELLVEANNNQDKPYFLILDEMNLSHVERYFADFLSVMESKEKFKLHSSEERLNKGRNIEVPKELYWPENLFVVGTVNIDETTYMFSPKVLDRANVIEFRVKSDDIKDFLNNPKNVKIKDMLGKGSTFSEEFVKISKEDTATNSSSKLNNTLLDFFKELQKVGAEFGYRTAMEIHRLYSQLSVIGNQSLEKETDSEEINNEETINNEDGDSKENYKESLSENEKIDIVIMQKLLPKLHGSRRKLVPILETLGTLCLKNKEKETFLNYVDEYKKGTSNNKYEVLYPISLEKIVRMYNGAIDNGFASYAEA